MTTNESENERAALNFCRKQIERLASESTTLGWRPSFRSNEIRVRRGRGEDRTKPHYMRRFRGGPVDGAMLLVPDGAAYWKVIVDAPEMATRDRADWTAGPCAKVATYERKRFQVQRGCDRYGQRIIEDLPDEYHYVPEGQ